MDKITLQKARDLGQEELERADIAEASLDAWYLMEYYFHIKRIDYLLNQGKEITESEFENYWSLIKQRAKHIPLQHITGTQEFMGLEFNISEAVLIPRQDTEILVEEVMKDADNKAVLDLCTGSGCIIISLAKLCRLKWAVGADISAMALEVGRSNAEKHQVNVSLIESDLFEKITGTFDRIVSNPPYIASDEIEKLMPEVKIYEPRLALDGKEDGLYFYKKIINMAKDYLNPHGELLFEIGYDQGEALTGLLKEADFKEIRVIKDLAGLDRVVKAVMN